jgi:hypothetical protein
MACVIFFSHTFERRCPGVFNIQKINDLVKQYPNCRVTFIEIPIFSIKEWNEHKKYKTPYQFKDHDLKLEEQFYNLNVMSQVPNDTHSHIFPIFLILDLSLFCSQEYPSLVFSLLLIHHFISRSCLSAVKLRI